MYFTIPKEYFFNKYWEHVPSGKILLYAGDVDIVCNFLGVQRFASSLKRNVTTEYVYWNYPKDGTSKHSEIGGFIRRYEGLAFATVRGAGHMVPTDRPEAALHLFSFFLDGKWS